MPTSICPDCTEEVFVDADIEPGSSLGVSNVAIDTLRLSVGSGVLTLIVARLAQRLDVTPIANETPHPVGMVVNRPTGGAPFQVSARTAS